MSTITTSSPHHEPGLGALDMRGKPGLLQALAVLLGSALLAVSSYIEVPMVPVPVTMQTFAVTLIGALYGWRLGGATIAAWLLEGALGLPVLAGGAAGATHFVGPTAGYLFAFPLAGAAMGWLVDRGWNGHRPFLAMIGFLLANLLCLGIGAARLAFGIGLEAAIASGVAPFLLGAVLKAGLGAMALRLLTSKA